MDEYNETLSRFGYNVGLRTYEVVESKCLDIAFLTILRTTRGFGRNEGRTAKARATAYTKGKSVHRPIPKKHAFYGPREDACRSP